LGVQRHTGGGVYCGLCDIVELPEEHECEVWGVVPRDVRSVRLLA
jgi:hypothetical protein